ncbi:AAA family ATPase [Dongia soli]|uniref:AAA family ATPase n=1 Tax=Dongia soli TaxID=600628 RepID=A0ABU5EEF1_9PROT|nr:AAA family ATPase [Dongia soli]MDY0884687.1 AAA family ATPase [Dongia soli]
MNPTFLSLQRLRVMKGGKAAYDQSFHRGVNIIRGENGSGKSTIADFIFFILGGEFADWKEAASYCEEVQAQLETRNGIITVRRSIATKLEPTFVFYGPMELAEKSGIDGWHRHTIRRVDKALSYSQVLFRACGIPEAPSQNSSNVTSHQILRLMYGDQRTPAPRLFRFESFDNRDIRIAVGELLCGINGYRLYETQLELRSLNAQFDETQRQLSGLYTGLPPDSSLRSVASLDEEIVSLKSEAVAVERKIENVDDELQESDDKAFREDRIKALLELRKAKDALRNAELLQETRRHERDSLGAFIKYLEDLSEKLKLTADAGELIGSIEFTYCPACLNPLREHTDPNTCILCGSSLDIEKQRSKYLQLQIDTRMQLKESNQLLDAGALELANGESDLRALRRDYERKLSEFATRFDLSNSPRESHLARFNIRLGQIHAELGHIEKLRDTLEKIDKLSAKKGSIQQKIDNAKALQERLQGASTKRLSTAMGLVSKIARQILAKDLLRQEEFKEAKNVTVDFGDDAILVDGKLNFAESSNVILKNAALVALFSAATQDSEFWHPRFVLLDNVEDKGMEEVRSHNFQKLIVNESQKAKFAHQIIFTTSTINPELELDEYVIGPKYTRENHTLNLKG